MHRKRNSLIIPLVSASLLTGCAAQATDRTYAPAPQALIQAAEQASQMRMVYADVHARASGHTVESVRLDARDADAPDFMRATVRLDYNGPMDNVLQRVANDIGYRVNEYSKPASGLSWTPWIRLSGSKPLLDHMREMNSQVPWHIVLDHTNRRLVVDYSDDGGMASQILRTRERRGSSVTGGGVNLPASPQQFSAEAQRAAASTLANDAPMPRAESTQMNLPSPTNAYRTTMPNEVWFVAVEGYSSDEHARSMVIWLAQIDLNAYIHEANASRHDVRVIAASSRDAIRIRDRLKDLGVPGQLGFEEPDKNDELKRRAEIAMRDGWPIEALEREARQLNLSTQTQPVRNDTAPAQARSEPQRQPRPGSTATAASADSNQAHAQSRVLTGDAASASGNTWGVQLAYSSNLAALGHESRRVEGMGYKTVLIPGSGNGHSLRAIEFESRAAAVAAQAQLRSAGFHDAYLVNPKGA